MTAKKSVPREMFTTAFTQLWSLLQGASHQTHHCFSLFRQEDGSWSPASSDGLVVTLKGLKKATASYDHKYKTDVKGIGNLPFLRKIFKRV